MTRGTCIRSKGVVFGGDMALGNMGEHVVKGYKFYANTGRRYDGVWEHSPFSQRVEMVDGEVTQVCPPEKLEEGQESRWSVSYPDTI